MSLSPAEIAVCEAWCKAHARKWQIYNRSQWKYKFHGKALVRFVEEAQMREDEMRLLLEYLSSDSCVSTLCVYDQSLEAGWKPIKAWYEISSKANGAVHSVRLYHGLNTDPSTQADGPYLTEDGCMYKVSLTYYWKQPEIIAVPPSTSGVAYRIVNLSRDDEDGRYTYAMEKRERVQQDVALYLGETDLLRDVSHEAHIGVREGVVAGQDASCDGAGKKVTKTVRKNEDCTHDVINDVTQDKAMLSKVVETSVGLHGKTITTQSVNVGAAESTAGLDVGETVRNEKTETGLWNTLKRTIDASFLQWIRKTCEKTVFRHIHTETVAQGADPGFTHTEEAGGGVVRSKDVQKTEFGYDVTETTRTDNSVPNAVVVTEKRLGGVVKTTVNRAQSQDASTANMKVGDSVRNEKTDSGLVDQTITENLPQDVGTVDESCEKTAHAHTHTKTEVLGSDPGAVDADEVADGVVHTTRKQLTDSGAFRVTDETKAARYTEVQSRTASSSQVSTQTNYRNADSIDGTGEGVNVQVETSAAKNDAGKVDGTRRVTRFNPEQRTVQTETAFSTEVVTVKEHEEAEQNPSRAFTRGTLYGLSSNPNGVGSATVHVTRRDAKPVLKTQTWESVNDSPNSWTKTRHKVVWFRNQMEIPTVETVYGSCNPTYHMNDFGLYDGVYHYTLLIDWGVGNGRGIEGRQYDRSEWMSVDLADAKYIPRRGVFYKVRTKGCKVRKRVLVSTPENMLSEYLQHPGYPGLGGGNQFVSRFSKFAGVDCVILYQEKTDGQTVWEKIPFWEQH